MQIFMARSFQEYDYGRVKNLQVYGTAQPPEIDLTKLRDVDVPIAVFQGDSDKLAHDEDLPWLLE